MSTRRSALVLLLGLGICACGGDTTTVEVTESDVEAVARGIHDRVITIDTHDDIPFNFATREVDPGVRAARQVDLPKMREGGLDVGFFIVYVGQGQNNPEGYAQAYEQAITKFEAIHRMATEMYPDQIELAYTADDVERIHSDGKLVAAIGIENGWPVGEDLANVATFHELGGRYITLAHNGHGDALIVYSGKDAFVRAGRTYGASDRPGLSVTCAKFIRDHDVALLGWDMMDARPDPYGLTFPVHGVLFNYGVALLDNALLEPLADACAEEGRYEFMFMGLPLKVARGTGSPANPIAMF